MLRKIFVGACAVWFVMAVVAMIHLSRPIKTTNAEYTLVDMHALQQALKLYAQYHDGNLPTPGQGLQALVEKSPDDSNWKGPYIESAVIPQDAWGQPYLYQIS